MYSEIPQGKTINIQGLDCHIPEEGYVYNHVTKLYEKRGVSTRNGGAKDQYWERQQMPSWYKDVLKKEDDYLKKKKEDDTPFYDERYEQFKRDEWDKRLNGHWIMIYNPSTKRDEPVYLTGFYYMLLQWFSIDIGYPKFIIPHLLKTYFLQYCIEDPLCMGMIDVTKRRFLKTFIGGLFILEYITRTKMVNGAIQSKTGNDAKKVFAKAIVYPFRKFPRFFRPEYDMSLGVNPKTEIRFQQTNIRGKKAEDGIDKDELGSAIDWGSADPVHYDGQKLHRYFGDEYAKCFGKGTKIRMYDGTAKNVEDVEDGDFVMGDDSTPRLASGKTNGVEPMFEIKPNKGKGFICNESHILTLSVSDKIRIDGIKYKAGDIINITVKDYFKKLKGRQTKCVALYRTGWELKERFHIIDPYMFGVWLGDGNSRDFSVTSVDDEILCSINSFADEHGLFVRQKDDKISYHVTSTKAGVNHITKELRRLQVLKNKHIPQEYLCDSRENRLQLLAGIVDTDGHLIKRENGHAGVEIVQKRKEVSHGIYELATSLGFFANLAQETARMKRKDGSVYSCEVYQVSIYGDIDLIPTKVHRKKAVVSRTKNRRNPLKTGFKIEPIGDGEYYGFTVDRNNLFLLADGTVVHNTTEANVFDRHEVVRYCLLDEEGKIIGKALYSSTVEKLDSDKDGVQEAARQLWDASNQYKREANGMTQSGLYRFFQTADEGRNFDVYGYPNVEQTIKDILSDRESVKNNQRSLSARMKKEPRTEAEAWSEDADKCVFNLMKMDARESFLKDNPIVKRDVLFYRDGETQKVKWRDTRKGEDFYWRVSPDCDLNTPNQNKSVYDSGFKKPGNTKFGAITVDSYSNSQGGRKYGSKASAWLGIKKDGVRKAVGWLYGRPDVKEELHNQVMLCAEFFGVQAWYEHTSDDYLSYFRERGKVGYLGIYPMSMIDHTKRGKENLERHKGTPITPFSLTKQLDKGIYYFEEYTDWIDFEEVFPLARKFDPYNRTESDAIVSLLMLITILDEPVYSVPPIATPLIQVYQGNRVAQSV